MKTPPDILLLALAGALTEAEHKNAAKHLVAGFLWACYPEWFEKTYPILKQYEKEAGK